VCPAALQETIGSAIAISILSNGHVPLYAGCIIVSISAFSLLLLEQIGFRQLEALFGVLIGIEAVALGINFANAPIAATDVLKGVFIPRVSAKNVLNLSASTSPPAKAVLMVIVRYWFGTFEIVKASAHTMIFLAG
jgi:NRAMP (natural resistance-associated macrophage protein)-like metal ion transporter